jgi:Mrp family chromosome partitioning ATPase
MSKNFEVLLRAERETGLFEPAGAPPQAPDFVRPSVHCDDSVRKEETKLVQQVFLLPGSAAPRTVVFSAVDHEAGAVGICARAGENLANETLLPVCIVDGSLQRPALHHYFGVPNHRGLSNAVLDSGPIRDFVYSLPGGNLSLLCAGSRSGDSAALWKSDRLRSRVAELREEYSYVLIYAPSVSQHVDAALLGQVADGVILIVEWNITRRETARKAKDSLATSNVKILGAVVNNRTFPIPESLYRRL